MRGIVRDLRIPVENFSWSGTSPYGTPLETTLATIEAGKLFSVKPCPTLDELERIEVKPPEITQTFGDFVRAKAKDNPDGYTFKWLDQAKFYGE